MDKIVGGNENSLSGLVNEEVTINKIGKKDQIIAIMSNIPVMISIVLEKNKLFINRYPFLVFFASLASAAD